MAGAGALLALVAGVSAAPATAAPLDTEVTADCPAPVPVATVQAGLVGEGRTVVRGRTPEPFRVEVLGVLADGIGAGRDMVVIKVSDLPGGHVVDQGGGIWAGMSGSPVYVGDRLLGAVSYGFTSSPSPIGGLTPAADMLDLLRLGTPAVKATPVVPARQEVALPAAAKRALAAQARTAAPRGNLERLVTPLAVSGLRPQRLNRLQADADAAGLSVRTFAAGRATAPVAGAVPAARPQPGGNFAAVLSYGDVTSAGIGTTTAVCGDQALAFGHPMDLAGPSAYGANDADALTIIEDANTGSFKMANVGAPFGTVDQDRTSGLRADLRTTAALTDVTTVLRNGDTGRTRTGTTRVTDQSVLPGLLPYAVFANQDAVFDEWGDGTATSDWTITGTRRGGAPFTVRRSNAFASRDDVTVDPAVDVALAADALVNNDFEDVTLTGVTFGSTMATRFEQKHVTKMEISVDGGRYSTRRVTVKAGARLTIRVSTAPFRSTRATTTTLRLTVPKSARGRSGVLTVNGGVNLAQQGEDDVSAGCLLAGQGCGTPEATTLDAVIKGLQTAPRNDEVVAQLLLASDSEDEEADATVVASARRTQRLTVTGSRGIEVTVRP